MIGKQRCFHNYIRIYVVYTPFTHPKSAPRQAPFYAGLRAVDLRSSPAGVTMVTVAQVVEQWIMVPPVVSSSLVGHPMGR